MASLGDLLHRFAGFALLLLFFERIDRSTIVRQGTSKRFVHTSILQGEDYVRELLNEKRSCRIHRALGVSKPEFIFMPERA